MIVLMRHAHTDAGAGRCIGRTDVPLSAEGARQAADLAEILGGCAFSRLCSSPSGRARDTLAPLASHRGVETEILSGLDEIDMGAWDGLSFDEIRARFPADYARRGASFGDFRPSGGESFNDAANRAMQVLSALASGPQHVLAVTHAGVVRAILCRLTGHDMNDPFQFKPFHVGCTVLAANGLDVVETGVEPGLLPDVLRR